MAEVAAAQELFAAGRTDTARQRLEALLAKVAREGPLVRLAVARPLLDICDRTRDGACLARHAKAFVDAAGEAGGDPVFRARLALEAIYYVDSMRALNGMASETLLASPTWKQQVSYDGEIYLRRQILASNLLLQANRPAELDLALNKILSLLASLQNPQAARTTVAASLADVIGALLEIGDAERAYGLYRAAGAQAAEALPPLSLDRALYRLSEARLLQQVGDPAAAGPALDEAVAVLRRIELPAGTRDPLLAEALTLKAALAAIAKDPAAAEAALAQHPYAALYAGPGRTAAEPGEVAYLAARVMVAAASGRPDPRAAAALRAGPRQDHPVAAIHRAAGLALAASEGAEKRRRLSELAERIANRARAQDRAGRLGRLDAVEQALVALALTNAAPPGSAAEAEARFVLIQLAGRTGASFDADALAALAQAGDEGRRRTLQQALRLKARRDRLERESLQAALSTLTAPAAPGLLGHDVQRRALLRDYDERLASAEAELAAGGASIRGPRLVSLAQLKATLSEGEAALVVTPAGDGQAHLCVRRDRVVFTFAPVDRLRMKVDGKMVQAALTGSHPPSETLDAQFPAEAARRLHEALLGPATACLKPGDHIHWLGGVGSTPAPLAVLLASVPPKAGAGYDLGQADWLVRRHAVSYAGSAAALTALRRSEAASRADLGFLGVGDPKLDGRLPNGQTRAAAVTRGVRAGGRFSGLAPLPETADELRASGQAFRSPKLLLGEAATEAAVRRQVLGDYRYLSFATHGLLREDLQGLADPALVLTPASASDARDDGLLTASEIADMHLAARFVALSACNTANFDFDQQAQDLPALASAFAVSGVPATLGTLWPVDSETGKRVVAAVFATLGSNSAGPAEALAKAQRAFLASPPGRAYLHPRFWAPFVLMGDGAPRPEPAGDRLPLGGVETLDGPGGEVLALAEAPGGVASRFIAAPDAAGRPGEGVRLASAGAEAWRSLGHQGRASRVLERLGDRLIAGGYEAGPGGRIIPRLDAYDLAGRRVATWRGDGLSTHDAGFLAAARRGDELVVVVGERPRTGSARLHVLQVGPLLEPKLLFTIAAPAGARISNAAILPVGERLLVTYSADNLPSPQPEPNLEDYDPQLCAPARRSWAELRNAAGERLVMRAYDDLTFVAAAATPAGPVVAGARHSGCESERRAAVLALDGGLEPRTLYQDATLGMSEVRALASLPGGGLLAAAYKRNLFAFAAGPAASGALAAGSSFSTMVVTLNPAGRAAAPKLLDAGADLIPTAALAVGGGDVLVGGSLAGEAAILRFSPSPETRPR